MTSHLPDHQQRLDALARRVFPAPEPKRTPAAPVTPELGLDAQEIMRLASRASNGPEIDALYRGDLCGRPSESEARGALIWRLIFYTRDPGLLEQLLRGSRRDTSRFDTRRGPETFLQYEIRRALDRYDGETYSPGRAQTPPPAPAPVDTSGEIAALRADVEALHGEVATLKRELAEERAARSELVYALRNPAVKTERGTAIAAACILEHKKSQDPGRELPDKGGGWHRVYLDAVAEQAGCSPQRASAHLDRLAEWGVIEKTLQWGSRDRVNRETGEVVREGVKEMYLRSERPLSVTLATLATLEPEKPQTWGGARPKVCPDHPEAGTVKKWTLHCQQCDRALDEGVDFKRPPTFQDEVSSNTPPSVAVIPSFQDESRGIEHLPGYIPSAPIPATSRNHPGGSL